MNEPLGEHGGEVTRKVTLFGQTHKVGTKLSPELLGKVSERHRRALSGAGLVKYYSEPEGAAADFSSKSPKVKTTVKAKSPQTKPKTKAKAKAKAKSGKKSAKSSK